MTNDFQEVVLTANEQRLSLWLIVGLLTILGSGGWWLLRQTLGGIKNLSRRLQNIEWAALRAGWDLRLPDDKP